MEHWITVGEGGALAIARIVAIANARSAPVKRWLATIDPTRVLDLTYGYPRRAVVLLDNDYIALVSIAPDALAHQLNGGFSHDHA